MNKSTVQPVNSWMNTALAWLTGLLTLILAAFSFILSFNALSALAGEHGVSIPPLFPFVVEFGMIVFSLNALYRSLQGEQARVQWALIIGSSLLAGGFNIAHAAADPLSRFIAAMPSLFLLLSFESFLNLIKHGVKRNGAVQSLLAITEQFKAKETELNNLLSQKRQELEQAVKAKHSELERLNSELERLNTLRLNTEQKEVFSPEQQVSTAEHLSEQQVFTPEQRRVQLMNILQNEGDIGATKFAERLGASRGTIYKDIDALIEEGTISRNGAGLKLR